LKGAYKKIQFPKVIFMWPPPDEKGSRSWGPVEKRKFIVFKIITSFSIYVILVDDFESQFLASIFFFGSKLVPETSKKY